MKKITTLLVLIMLSAFIQETYGQACPIISCSQVVSVPGGYQGLITYTNPTSGAKSIKISVYTTGNNVCYTECFQAFPGGQRTYTSPTFNCQPTQIVIESFTGGINCHGTSCTVVVPVKLASFTTTRKGNSVSVGWSTASEQNNKGFAVERYIANVWQQIAFVGSKATGGSSSNYLYYFYSDVNFNKDITQYRLKQVDIDGKGTLSDVSVVSGSSFVNAHIWPNPAIAGGDVNIAFGDSKVCTIDLLDLSGKVIASWKNFPGNSITLPKAAPGNYFFKLKIHDAVETIKIALL